MAEKLSLVLTILLLIFLLGAYNTPFSYCNKPLAYNLGVLDSKFGLEKTEALKDIKIAEDILETAYGKNLFEYASPSAEISINFVFDERSELNSEITKQKSQVSKTDVSLKAKIAQYQKDVAALRAKIDALNAEIKKYNDQGGAPPDAYESIIARQRELTEEGNVLNERAKALNQETQKYNLSVGNLNQNISDFNQALSENPEEGIYDDETKSITIYFVNTKDELVHTLAHEMGHSIGMNHVENTQAIMYEKTSESLKVTDEDLGEIKKACAEFPLLEYWMGNIKRNLISLTEKGLQTVN